MGRRHNRPDSSLFHACVAPDQHKLVEQTIPAAVLVDEEMKMHKEKEDGEVVTHMSTTEARSGSPTRMTRNILTVSLVLIVLALVIALGFGFFETGQTGADDVNTDNMAVSNAN